ncbi:helix-turn-helix domain-containing protein [Paenarthrobacter histidinolovorans]|uniref:helix-turn-helix domain-containing protein n=1 Tax=Paenarthrobacter histidinolovorans TaxID=43664 RepID=UPI00166C49A7|nr:helix-turn-helix domain-containing protein [Paenarthrobacter histidinolovorans]
MSRPRGEVRPPAAYVHGINAPVVIVPARIAAWLERNAGLNQIRINARGADPEVDSVLNALRLAALTWRTAATGSPQAPEPEAARESKWYSTTDAAERLGITDRAVRLAIQEKRLHATNLDGRWRISTEDIEHFKAAKAA